MIDLNAWSLSRSRIAQGAAAATTLLLFACVSTIEVPSVLPQSADLPPDYGMVVGSILLSTPSDASDADDQEIIESIKSKSYEAIIGRYVVHDYGIASRVEHPGDLYRVAFTAGVEQPFVVRAPAGTYSIQRISSTASTIFGAPSGGCQIEGIANLNIRTGQTIYAGHLSLLTEFKPDRGRNMVRMLRNLGQLSAEHSEAALELKASVLDLRDEDLSQLGILDPARQAGVGTELMFVDQRKGWDCWESQPPPPPVPVQNR